MKPRPSLRLSLAPLPPGLAAAAPFVLLASCAHLGRLRPAPGSWASAATVLAAAPLVLSGQAVWLTAAGALAGASGFWASRRWLRESRAASRDPQSIVVDEVMGQALVLAAAPPHGGGLLAAFLLFRVFDIAKIWPARAAESLPGAAGIMLDDAAAAAWAVLCLWGLEAAGLWTLAV